MLSGYKVRTVGREVGAVRERGLEVANTYIHAQSPYIFTHARLRSAFSRNSVKKWYAFRSCFNLSTPYPDFPRKQASKEANAIAKPPVSGVQLPQLPEHSPTRRHTELSPRVGTAPT